MASFSVMAHRVELTYRFDSNHSQIRVRSTTASSRAAQVKSLRTFRCTPMVLPCYASNNTYLTNIIRANTINTQIQRGGGGSFVARLSHLTILWPRIPFEAEHRSYSNRGTSNNWALIPFFPYETFCWYILSTSFFAFCGHHPSPGVAIVFSLPRTST